MADKPPSSKPPESVLFYLALGAIAGLRKLLYRMATAGSLGDALCFDFTDLPPGMELEPPYEQEGFVFSGRAESALRIVQWGAPAGKAKLAVPEEGLRIRLPYPALWATARVAQYGGEPPRLLAFQGDALCAESAGAPGENVLQTLSVQGGPFERLEIDAEGGEPLLFDVCIPVRSDGGV